MTYRKADGVLKPLDEVLLPDPRFECYVIESAVGVRPFELADMHGRLSDTKLNPNVPDKVCRQLETARNLMLYSWFVFEFQTVAEMQAYAALELAMRERFSHPKRKIRTKKGVKLVPLMLAELLDRAVKEGIIVPDKLPAWERVKAYRKWHETELLLPLGAPMSATEWLEHVAEILPRSRNELAHGTPKLYLSASMSQLDLCADLINALFSK